MKEKVAALIACLESLKKGEREEKMLRLIDRLQFECRYAELTDEEKADADIGNVSISPECRATLDGETSEAGFERRLDMYARSIFMRKCAWNDYLRGITHEKPPLSKQEKTAA